MGTMGLTLPWGARISPVPHESERRVEPSQDPAASSGPGIADAHSEDLAQALRASRGICAPTSVFTGSMGRA
jgi:hypothetical protein